MATVTDFASAPRVSVVVPAFDGARFLPATLKAILGQTWRDLELIVVDDASTDATPAILAEAARRDPRVRVERVPWGGHTRATTRGIALARGELYAHCDHDDVWEPTRLERGVAFLDAHPEVGVVGSAATVVDASDRPIGVTDPPCDPAAVAAAMREADAVVNSTALARLALVRELGGHRQAFHQASDYDLWMRASERSEVANLPERLIRYRVHFGNTSVRRLEVTARGLVAVRTEGRRRREGRPARSRIAPTTRTSSSVPSAPIRARWRPRRSAPRSTSPTSPGGQATPGPSGSSCGRSTGSDGRPPCRGAAHGTCSNAPRTSTRTRGAPCGPSEPASRRA